MAQAPVTTRGRGGRAGTWYLFLVPALLLYSLFVVYPLLTGLSYSVFSWKGTVRDAFVGVDNYVGLFTNEAFRSKLLSVGGSIDPLEAFRAVRGRDADPTPLMRRRGLIPA